jgi:Delta7-sterol 5-desaturase
LDSFFYFLDKDFWSKPGLIALLIVTIFLIVLVRYLLTALSYHEVLRRIFKKRFREEVNVSQKSREVMWSALSSLIFAGLSVLTFYFYQKGFTRIYTHLAERSILYFLASIPIYLILYESYYYWLHRWMHKPSVFRIVHKVHHQSIHPTVFTSFSFHPLEAVLQFIFLPVALAIIPIHYYALGIVLLIWTVSAVVNHAGAEIFPKNFTRHPIGKWMIGSTHHDLHHKEFKTNFGLYLTFWDRWMKTENDKLEKQFDDNKSAISRSRSQHHP